MLFPIPSLSELSARHEESCKKHTNTSLNKDDLLTSFINHNMCCQRVLLSWQSQKSHRHQVKSIYTSKSYYTTGDMMSTHLSYHFGYKITPRHPLMPKQDLRATYLRSKLIISCNLHLHLQISPNLRWMSFNLWSSPTNHVPEIIC